MLPSIEPIRFQLRGPHAQYPDYFRLYQLLAAPFARKKSLRNILVGFAAGAVIGASLTAAAAYWRLWKSAALTIDTGLNDRPVLLEGTPFWICVFAVFAVGVAAASLAYVRASRRMIRNMYEASRQEPSDWIMQIGETGFQTEVQGIVTVVPWHSTNSFHEAATASFLYFNRGLNGFVIPNEAFADSSERAACMAFIRSKVARH
jgi:hypothetical protein